MAPLYPTADDVEIFLLIEVRHPREAARAAELRLAELQRLVESAGGRIADSEIIALRSINAAYYLSRPRVEEELAPRVRQLGVTGVVFDAPLSPAQARNIERALEVKVLDRTAVILDIFARRARTHEGRLQIELAQLRYLMPRLTGRGHELSRLGGGIGTRGPGETKLETDRRRILARINQLKKAIEAIRRTRATQRKRREQNQLPTAAIVGYTNAGKSTLINRLTGASIFTADQLFATLDPTARALALPHGARIAVIDTVGFIRDLPASLSIAFRATLEEMNYADLLVQVVDIASPNRREELAATDETLADLGLEKVPRLLVWNKIDQLEGVPAKDLHEMDDPRPQVEVSALTGEGIEELLREIERIMTSDYVLDTFLIPYDRLDQLTEVRARGQIVSERYEETGLRITARVPPFLAARLARYEIDAAESPEPAEPTEPPE
jgi:GTP-binding protein HflX